MELCAMNKENVHEWRTFLNQCLQLKNSYKMLLNSFILDFYTLNHWSNVNPRWRDALLQFSLKDIAALLNIKSSFDRVVSLSLLAFRAACNACSLPRFPLQDAESILSYLNKDINNDCSVWKEDVISEHVFRRHIKPKKQHEIKRMAWVVSQLEGERIVDVGSGKGHLARILAYKYRNKVTCLEGNEEYVNSAKQYDLKTESELKKKGVDRFSSPFHCCVHVPKDIHPEQFLSEIGVLDDDIVLTSLHGCGDLSATLLRLFSTSNRISSLAVVGCCYMKLSSNCDSGCSGYPLSGIVKAECDSDLSYEAREMACHAVEMYHTRLLNHQELDKLKIHCYRAVLETILVGKDPSLKHLGLQGVPHGHKFSFREYAIKAVKKLGIILDKKELVNDEVRAALLGWKNVVMFYVLRVMLAPVIETIIILDRMFYLLENDISCALIPAFDPLVSPRNYILMATKK